MTREQGVQIATRMMSIYMFIWAVSDVLTLTYKVLSLHHYILDLAASHQSTANEAYLRHMVRLDSVYLGETIARITLWLAAAKWFYACGPWIQGFFADGVRPQEIDNEVSLK